MVQRPDAQRDDRRRVPDFNEAAPVMVQRPGAVSKCRRSCTDFNEAAPVMVQRRVLGSKNIFSIS